MANKGQQTLGYEKYGLSSYQVFQGAILWLPKRSETLNPFYNPNKQRIYKVDANERALYDTAGYFHPILVVSRPADHPDVIDFVEMRGFHNSWIETPQAGVKADQYQFYIPIEPSKPHPFLRSYDNGKHANVQHHYEPLVLRHCLENTQENSYVCVHDVYRMKWKLAQQFYDMNRPNDFHIWGVEDMEAPLHLTQQHAGYAPGRQYRKHWLDWLRTMKYAIPLHFRRFAPKSILTAFQGSLRLWRNAVTSLVKWDALCWASEPYVRTIWSIVLISTMLAVAERGLWAALLVVEFCKDLLPSLIFLALQEMPAWWTAEMD